MRLHQFPHDLAVYEVIMPNQVTGPKKIKAWIRNEGLNTESSFTVSAIIDGVLHETYAPPVSIYPGGIVEVNFPTPYDFTEAGTYDVVVEVNVNGDVNPDNDSNFTNVHNLDFQGYYVMEQLNSGSFGGDDVFGIPGVNTVFLEVVDFETNKRRFRGDYLGGQGFNGWDYYFTLENGNVVFDDDQPTPNGCEEQIFLGTANSPGAYDESNDGEFTLTLQDNSTGVCGESSPDVTFRLTKMDKISVNQGDKDALVALYESTDGPNWWNPWILDQSPIYMAWCDGQFGWASSRV